MHNRLLAIGLLTLSLGAVPAAADVDLNGPWRLTVQTLFISSFACPVTVTQVGTAITVSGPGCTVPFNASGTIDTVTGVFSGSGASDPIVCPTLNITGTSGGTSTGFGGDFTCTGGVLPVTGTFQGSLCGNNVVDDGEDCDDGDVQTNDCCSSTCTYEPNKSFCFAPLCTTGECNATGTCVTTPEPAGTSCGTGGECNTDECDGTGLCTHPLRPVGSSCFGDFNPCTDGACDAAGTCVLTNNTAPCDDFNACTLGDTCAAGSCVPGSPGPAGVECELDGDLCSLESCDGGGNCLATGECSDCCEGCVAEPAECKDPTVPGAKAHIRHVNGTRDVLRFIWKQGEETTLGDLGTPLAGTDYTLCVYFEPYPYNGTLDLVYRATAPAGGTCAGQPCWQPIGTRGFVYKDRDRTPDGIHLLKLKTGATGFATAVVKGKGPNLKVPHLGDGTGGGLGTPIIQLRSSDAGCFEAHFPTATRNNSVEFKSNAGE
jgi:cysteine-rich repeat protein